MTPSTRSRILMRPSLNQNERLYCAEGLAATGLRLTTRRHLGGAQREALRREMGEGIVAWLWVLS